MENNTITAADLVAEKNRRIEWTNEFYPHFTWEASDQQITREIQNMERQIVEWIGKEK